MFNQLCLPCHILNLHDINKYKVKHIICYGELCNKASNQLNNVLLSNTLKEAFNIAYNIKLNNKIILFSPAASSYDQNDNYKKRGKHFDKFVKKI